MVVDVALFGKGSVVTVEMLVGLVVVVMVVIYVGLVVVVVGVGLVSLNRWCKLISGRRQSPDVEIK